MIKNNWKILIAFFVLAFLLRLFYLICMVGLDTIPDPLYGDPTKYDRIAFNLVQGKGFSLEPDVPTSWMPPLYPLFLTSIYYIFGHSYPAVRIIQALISASLCIIIYLIGKRLINPKAALIASFLAIFSPALIYFSGALMTESIFIFLLSLCILSFLKLKEAPNLRNQVILGLALGFSILTRPSLLLFPIFSLIWFLIIFRTWTLTLRKFLVVLSFSFLVIAPWTVRNYMVHHSFVPVATSGGKAFFIGNNQWANGSDCWPGKGEDWSKLGLEPPSLGSRGWKELSEVENDRRFFQLGMDWVKDNPGKFIALWPRKLASLWSWRIQTTSHIGKRYEAFYSIYYLGLILVSLLGTLLTRSQWKKLSIIYFLLLYFSLLSMITLGVTRFRLPLEPYLLILSAAGIEHLAKR